MSPDAVVDRVSPDEYRAAVDGLAVFDRSSRMRLRVFGRAPRQMLNGILTGTLPLPPEEAADGVWGGVATYHAVLTPKGKMITDLWVFLLGDEAEEGFLLDVPVAGSASLLDHFAKVLPPRFARHEDVSEDTGMLAVTGSEAAAALSKIAFGLRIEGTELEGLDEGAWRMVGRAPGALAVARVREVAPDAYWVLGERKAVSALRDRLIEAGGVATGPDTWTTLRVEAGRPEFGVDMTDTTLPIEAGIHDRAIDYQKGCYTGQEVIVRIRDRGHVNRHFHRLVLGDVRVPETGTELFGPGDDTKSVGWITSAVRSPAEDAVVALAYVRRGVERVVFDGHEVAVG
ncbi:MAG: hypothetical protein WD995_07105 [Gemmatimonadota bacterium]